MSEPSRYGFIDPLYDALERLFYRYIAGCKYFAVSGKDNTLYLTSSPGAKTGDHEITGQGNESCIGVDPAANVLIDISGLNNHIYLEPELYGTKIYKTQSYAKGCIISIKRIGA